MTSVVILGCAAGLLLISVFLHRGRTRRSRLINAALCALLIAMLLRDFAPNSVAFETAVRLLFLATQLAVVLLILTFVQGPPIRRTVRIAYGTAGCFAIFQVLLALVAPTRPDGTVFMAHEVGGSWIGIVYYLAFFVPIAITTATVAIGCGKATLTPGQPFLARLPLACVVIGTFFSAWFLVVSFGNILNPSPSGGIETKDSLLAAGMLIVLVGLAVGVLARVIGSIREVVAWRAIREVVLPLWQISTNLQPEVVLPSDEWASHSRRTAIVRLVVETHDALTLLRGDADPALTYVR